MTVTVVISITVAYLGTLATIVVLLGGRISALEANLGARMSAIEGRLTAVEASVNHLSEVVGELRGRIDTLEKAR